MTGGGLKLWTQALPPDGPDQRLVKVLSAPTPRIRCGIRISFRSVEDTVIEARKVTILMHKPQFE